MSHKHLKYQHERISDLRVPLLLSLILINLVILNFVVFKSGVSTVVHQSSTQPTQAPAATQAIAAVQATSQTCPVSCIDEIQKATSSGARAQVSVGNTPQVTTEAFREHFVPLGSGETDAGEWEDIPGLQVYIDTQQYSPIKEAVLEASVRVPTKNQWVDVRLYNVTDKHPVWFSQVRFPGGSDPTLVRSDPIVLDQGRKLYQLQMQTQLRHTAYLDQSRIHITTF